MSAFPHLKQFPPHSSTKNAIEVQRLSLVLIKRNLNNLLLLYI
jgi:hypothetical protein